MCKITEDKKIEQKNRMPDFDKSGVELFHVPQSDHFFEGIISLAVSSDLNSIFSHPLSTVWANRGYNGDKL